ncbi:MAG: hypothetical protein KKF46_01010 [Nanoarchaeota archaeon]|nr:hypothetical protein [Nanoarchaeota archaeon]MBU1320913.1 hypothetical protein [Nanoarchaeota archaeon]MBU1597562.1 hypothetical protein [Nanoarchaeota archaeon]MBU2441935.1 hypothetical protein [Nanoarchaeota archaeon]
MTNCRVCGQDFNDENSSLVICRHHEGNVHLGCCLDTCSWSKEPCHHCVGVFGKI